MKSEKLMLITAIAAIVLAVPAYLAAQNRQEQRTNRHYHYWFIDLGTFGGAR